MAMHNLGLAYLNGDGVPIDFKKAYEWSDASVKADSNSPSNVNLGLLYMQGKYVERDYLKAYEHFSISAENGVQVAYNNLGLIYMNGLLGNKDYEKARDYFSKVTDEEYSGLSHCNLGVLYQNGFGVEKNESKAFDYYQSAATQNFPIAYNNLGICYSEGIGVATADRKLALENFQKAADMGVAIAQAFLGYKFHYGIDVRQNIKEAIRLYTLAANNGNVTADII